MTKISSANTKDCGCKKNESRGTIYIGGPYFNTGSQYAQKLISDQLEAVGFETILPQRDLLDITLYLGPVLLAEGVSDENLAKIVSEIIFNIGTYELYISDGIVGNLEKVDPDAGAVSQCALMYSMGRGVVYLKEDISSFVASLVLNPIINGLATVPVVNQVVLLPQAVQTSLDLTADRNVPFNELSQELQNTIKKGQNQLRKYTELIEEYKRNETVMNCEDV